MALEDELKTAVAQRYRMAWDITAATSVPDESTVNLGNQGKRIEATILYADLADSTKLVDQYPDDFAAEIYGTFLHCASRIIRANGGTITAFDGDRVMAVYMGAQKEADACWTGFRINRAMIDIIRPALRAQYGDNVYLPSHTVGIDNSTVLVVKEGVRGDNDLVWVGRAANHAAKLCTLDHSYQTRATPEVVAVLPAALLTTVSATPVWEAESWPEMDNRVIFRSSCVATGM